MIALLLTMAAEDPTPTQWVSTGVGVGSPVLAGGILLYLLKTIQGFLKDERASQLDHQKELSEAHSKTVKVMMDGLEQSAMHATTMAKGITEASASQVAAIQAAKDLVSEIDRIKHAA